jgi:hypothetical protein
MYPKQPLLLLTIALLTFWSAEGLAQLLNTPPSDPVRALASDAISKLASGNASGTIAKIHEPPTWDKGRVAADRQQVTTNLVLLLKEFGTISEAQLLVGQVSFYEIQVAGADVPYWQSLPNFGMDARVTYLVKFSKAGPGVVAIALTRASGSWELRSVSLGLDRKGPHSKERMIRIGRTFLKAARPKMTKVEIEKTLAMILAIEPQ